MKWTATLSNKQSMEERDDSSWQMLMSYCNIYNVCLTGLTLWDHYPFYCPFNADGYWHAKSMRIYPDKTEHFSGVGWVVNNKLHCFWTGSGRSWTEIREPVESQIIWKSTS